MSADDIRKALRDFPPGTFKFFSGGGTGVDGDIIAHSTNYAEVASRIRFAEAAGCDLEAISLRLQVIDFWLRILLVNRAPDVKRQRETGRLLEQCFHEAGLEKNLYDRLLLFNRTRTDAIHGFVIGAASYSDITKAARSSAGLAGELIGFVIQHAGVVVTPESFETWHGVGDMILNVADIARQAASLGA